ncbi:E-selectin-like [Osmerus eperlanus]|uniref:E-selectin-like n=1 Tax=Osmerus eperlanus TaxID=29151 RepID=UPI002E0DB411
MDFCISYQPVRGSRISTFCISFALIYSGLCLWSSVEGWSYHYSNNTMQWEDARLWCQEHYTDMVAIQDQREIAHLNAIIPRNPSGPGSGYYWIGIRKVEGVWTWVGTNKALTAEAENWAAGEPNNGRNANGRNEDCVEMYIKREKDNTKWNDESCKKKKRPLCYTASCAKDSCFHGECVETINSHKCQCFEGFYGEQCEHVVQCKQEEVPVLAKASLECLHPNGHFSYNSKCQYSCEQGYQLNSSGIMTCTATKQWSEQPPSCELITCSELLVPVNGLMDCQHPLGSFSYLSTCGVTCKEGFELVDPGSTSLQCGASGQWNNSLTQCAAVQCPALGAPDNGTITCGGDPETEFSYGRSCSFSCAEGYRLQGASLVTCAADASWSEEMPRCEAIKCSKPVGGTKLLTRCSPAADELWPGSSCTFSCAAGYEMQGEPSIECSREGEWSADTPTCRAVQCPSPSAPLGGQVSCVAPSPSTSAPVGGAHPWGSVCSYLCDEGHDHQGALGTECVGSGVWSSEIPTCTAVRCPLLQAPANGAVSCSNRDLNETVFGSECSFTCEEGHALHGHAHITCNLHGNWTREAPRCEAAPFLEALLTPTNMGLAAGGAVSLSGLSLAIWLLKRLRQKGNKFELNSFSDVEDPPQVYKNSIDSLI